MQAEDDGAGDDGDSEEDESGTDVAWREPISQSAPQFRHRYENPYASAATGTPEDAEEDDGDSEHDGCEPEEDGGDPIFSGVPHYGIDQTRGPVMRALAEVAIGNDR